jgi:antitoxin CptB
MNELSRLRWHCRRGTREMDILLENYLDHHYFNAGSEEQQCFSDLLALEDSVLLSYLMMGKLPESEKIASLLNKIRVCSGSS